MSEAELQSEIAEYIAFHYRDAMFHSDFGSGVKLTPAQAVRQKRQNGGRRAWPDLFVAEPVRTEEGDVYYGLFIELKRKGVKLKKRDGEWATPHIAEQAEVLERLRFRGYRAEFACGFDEAKELIDEYLKEMEK